MNCNGEAGDGDFIASLGLPFLSHRFKRASALINEGTTRLLREQGCTAPATSASTLLLLDQHGPLGIMEIAARLKLDHALITRMSSSLAESRYVDVETDSEDKRRRIVSLTSQGKEQAEKIRRINRIIAEAFQEIFEETGIDLLAAIERFEDALGEKSMVDRLADRNSVELPA